jgi:hypothetical protein
VTGCHGNGDHCCYLEGQRCPFLEENTIPGRRWVCGLRRELSSWDAVHRDPRYLTVVKPVLKAKGGCDCGDFPQRCSGIAAALLRGERPDLCCFETMLGGVRAGAANA